MTHFGARVGEEPVILDAQGGCFFTRIKCLAIALDPYILEQGSLFDEGDPVRPLLRRMISEHSPARLIIFSSRGSISIRNLLWQFPIPTQYVGQDALNQLQIDSVSFQMPERPALNELVCTYGHVASSQTGQPGFEISAQGLILPLLFAYDVSPRVESHHCEFFPMNLELSAL